MINVDDYQVDLLETCRFGLDGGAMFGVVPKSLWERAYATADSRNRIPMAARALLIRGKGKTIVVDTGNSPFMAEKLLDIYGIDFSQYSFEASLQRVGVNAEDVTDVILTHLHFDHAGGAVIQADGEFMPRFTNAKYYVQKRHLDWARKPSVKDRASFMPEYYEPLVNHSVLELLDGDGELFPTVSAWIPSTVTHRSCRPSRSVGKGACSMRPTSCRQALMCRCHMAWLMTMNR